VALPFRYGYKHREQGTARRGDMDTFSLDTKQVSRSIETAERKDDQPP
jgi:hypothetical protein